MSSDGLVAILGERSYRVERPWGRLPDGMKIGVVSKVATDSGDNVYVCERTGPPVLAFDPDGNFVRSWGEGAIVDPHGITVTPDDHVMVVDRDAHQILAYDTRGNLLYTLGERHRPRNQAPFNHPTDVAVGPKGDIYVTDGYGNTLVHRFSPDLKLVRSWGGRGSGPGQFTTPHGVAVLADGRVLAGDRENNRIQVFTADGDYLRDFGPFYHPTDIHVDRDGLIYVSDQVPRVTMLDADGTILGSCRPTSVLPHGVRGDSRGNLYFTENRTLTITRLTPIP